jgi:hypothetical protein
MAVNLSPYGGVGAQFLDNAGNVLTGGKIFTYAAGTTTNQATYTSSTGTTFHPNPIILDASGRVPSGGEIWLTDGLLYKFVLETSTGVLIATYDNIAGINSNFVNFTNEQEIQVATAGQTVFNLTTTNYSPGTNSLSVYVDGVNQYGPGASYAYLETNSTTVTFTNGLHVGAEVKFTTSQSNSSGGTNASVVSFTGFKGQTGVVQDLADNDGSDWIGFEPAGTGAVARSAQDKMRETVSVKDFGATGDGVTDDTTAIQDALAYCVANTPMRLVFPNGVYKCDSALGSYTTNDLTIDLCGSTIDFSGISVGSATACLSFTGVYAAAVALSSNATNETKTVNCVTSTFAANDMVKVYSNTVFDSTRTNSKIGELNFIYSIDSGSQLTTTMELQASYLTSASANIQKITPVNNIVVLNGKMIGPVADNNNTFGIQITAGYNCRIDGIETNNFSLTHIRLIDCVYSKVVNSHFKQAREDSSAYGVSFVDAAQDCIAANNSFTDVRHSLSTNNQGASFGVVRRILFSNNVVTDSAPATGGSGGDAIDTHAAAEQISIIGNTVNSSSNAGINFEARTGIVSNNLIKRTAAAGININPRADTNSSIVVSGNSILSAGEGAGSDEGIRVALAVTDMDFCVISNNQIYSLNTPIGLIPTGTNKFLQATVTGNSGASFPTSTTANGIFAQNAKISITGNNIKALTTAINLTNCNNSVVSNNIAEIFGTSGTLGLGISVSGTSSYINVSGNTVLYSATGITTTRGVNFTSANTVTYSAILGNVTNGFTTNINLAAGIGCISANNI